MKLYTILPPGVFAIVFLYMLGQALSQPEDPPLAPIKITVPAQNEKQP